MQKIDLTGRVFGRLTVLRQGPNQGIHIRWVCQCSCGELATVLSSNLRKGKQKSCGCLKKETLTKHGFATKATPRHPLYDVWKGMMRRCYVAKDEHYANYGGRGIRVDERWHDISCFAADVPARPSPRHSLDRIDNNRNYEPGNVRWATPKEQGNNRRTNVFFEIEAVRKTVTQWSEYAGVDVQVLKRRLAKGWSVQKAIETPVQKKGRPACSSS